MEEAGTLKDTLGKVKAKEVVDCLSDKLLIKLI